MSQKRRERKGEREGGGGRKSTVSLYSLLRVKSKNLRGQI